nr:hypothetical protein [Tanacetum cinerariifolium]
MSIQEMEDLKQHYLDEMLSLSNDLGIKYYRNDKIDIRFRRECEDMIDELKGKFNGISIEINKKRELQQREQAAKLSAYSTKPSLPTFKDPEDSHIMRNEDLSTVPEKESDEFIESSVEDLDPIPSESEDTSRSENEFIESSVEDLDPIPSESEDTSRSESECDMPVCDDYYSKNEGLDDIISSIIFLIEEFVGELAPINPIPQGIVKADFDPEEDIRLIEKLLNDVSSPHSSEELNYEIPDTIIESFSLSPILVEDSDSLMEEIDIFLDPDDSIPPGTENDDYDSEGDVLFLEELLNDDSISLPEYESFHADFYNVPSSSRPSEKNL